MVKKQDILDKLSEVKDPELGVNIVDLGLIYDVKVKGKDVAIKMTFTTPACPMMNYMLEMAKQKLEELEELDIEISIVFDPPWTPERMSKKAKIKLGMI
jgi:metal-sulfur cluster biosynthetic enzyme